MSSNPSRYRVVEYVAERILQARELLLAENISQGYDATGAVSSYGTSMAYRQGAMLNATVTVTGNVVTLAATNDSYPILIFIRDRWEPLIGGENVAVTLSATPTTQIYLNWQLALVTSTEDATLVDSSNTPAANMGELQLKLETSDRSGIAINTSGSTWNSSTQLAKNTSPIVLLLFTTVGASGGANYVVTPQDNVSPLALASNATGGLVKLTTGTSSGTALSSDDVAVTNPRNPVTGSVIDSSVGTPTPVLSGGTPVVNTDGSTQYTIDGSTYTKGISASKVIYLAGTQLLSACLDGILSAASALLGAFNSHKNAALGLSNTHPMPTPSQVGAAPSSHVGAALGTPGSSQAALTHPGLINTGSGGFQIQRSGSITANDPGFGIFDSGGSVLKAALYHAGDCYAYLSSIITATPGGSPLTSGFTSVNLGKMSTIAQVLADHVNQTDATTSTGNPHGLTLSSFSYDSFFTTNRYILQNMRTSPTGARKLVNNIPVVSTLRSVSGQPTSIVYPQQGGNGLETTPFLTSVYLPAAGYYYLATNPIIVTISICLDGFTGGGGANSNLYGYVIDAAGLTHLTACSQIQNGFDNPKMSISFTVGAGESYWAGIVSTAGNDGDGTWTEAIIG